MVGALKADRLGVIGPSICNILISVQKVIGSFIIYLIRLRAKLLLTANITYNILIALESQHPYSDNTPFLDYM